MKLVRFISSSLVILLSLFCVALHARVVRHTDVYKQAESPYFCVKIPALLRLKSGVLLALGEARYQSCGDYTKTDLVIKRSTDDGKTWGPLKVLVSNGYNFPGDSVPLDLALVKNDPNERLRAKVRTFDLTDILMKLIPWWFSFGVCRRFLSRVFSPPLPHPSGPHGLRLARQVVML